MPLDQTKSRKKYREPVKRTFAYVERNNDPEVPREEKTKYVIHFAGKNGNHNCSSRTLLSKVSFREQLKELDDRGAKFAKGRLPPDVERDEGTIEREPYNLSFLSQTSARYNGNK